MEEMENSENPILEMKGKAFIFLAKAFIYFDEKDQVWDSGDFEEENYFIAENSHALQLQLESKKNYEELGQVLFTGGYIDKKAIKEAFTLKLVHEEKNLKAMLKVVLPSLLQERFMHQTV